MAAPSATPVPPNPAVGRPARWRAWLARHPFVLVAMLSPGIVEYLSGSSALAGVVIAPAAFFVFLAANLGLYVPGVLLLREARVRWRGGWGTVLLLGVAYAIVEEGLALSTLFDPKAPVVGTLGVYGHFAGVSWVWLVGVVAVHVVFSLSVPILLLDLALPAQRGVRWLDRRSLIVVISVLATDTVALLLLTDVSFRFFAGPALILGSLAAIALLSLAAYRLPGDWVRPRTVAPRSGPAAFALVGASFWPGILVAQALGEAAHLPWPATFGLTGLLLLAYLAWFLGCVGREGNAPQRIAFSLGLIAPLIVVGAVSQLGVPVVLIADGAALWFFWHLWVRYRPASAPPRPGGATVAA